MADTVGSEGQNEQGQEDLAPLGSGVQEDEAMEEGQTGNTAMDTSLNFSNNRDEATPSPSSLEDMPKGGYSKSDRPILGTGVTPGMENVLLKRTPRERSTTDTQSVDTRGSGDSQGVSSGPNSVRSPRQKDPQRREKDREREERVRLARERLAEERRRKIEELREQQRVAQENRERQLELRRRKLEELRRREDERRAEVEERRRRREAIERERREAILQRAEERVARYEAWKKSGHKGGGGHYGFGSRTPRPICQPLDRAKRSSSHSTLIRRSPNGSDSDYVRPQRRALSACSTIRRHCCVDINRNGPYQGNAPPSRHLSVSTSVLYHKRKSDSGSLPGSMGQRPDSLLALNTIPEERRSFIAHHTTPPQKGKAVASPAGAGVRMRESKPPRKPRPASVAGSMPSFTHVETKTSPRSLSTDRLSRADRSRLRKEKDESKENDKDASTEKSSVKISRRSIDRLSTPRTSREKPDTSKKAEPSPKNDSPMPRMAPRKALSTSNLSSPPKPRKAVSTSNLAPARKPRSATREKPTRDAAQATPPPSTMSTAAASATPTISVATPDAAVSATEPAAAPSEDGTTPSTATPSAHPATEGGGEEHAKATPSGSPAPSATPTSAKSSEVEEYKARLAEKRRQARERAEREAELERQRLEQERLEEEERQRQEEEEQRRAEEEAMKLAEAARLQEEERLRKAIEAEEQRRAEEKLRHEAERKAKEEAEKKAKEEAERLEKERAERAKREEEERMQRKKRLEMIMKRVKTDTPAEDTTKTTDSPATSATSSPSKSAGSSTDSSPEDQHAEDSQPASGSQSTIVSSSSSLPARAADAMSTSTPDLGSETKIRLAISSRMETAANGDTPKFKSPLLQSLLGKKKLSRTSGTDGGKEGEKTLSLSTQDLSISRSTSSLDALEERSNGEGEGVMAMSVDSGLTESGMSRALSGDELDARAAAGGGQLMAPVNGLHHASAAPTAQDMADSSASLTESGVVAGSPVPSPAVSQTLVDNDFEQIIDLATVSNKNLEALRETTTTTVTTSEDLLNFNNVEVGAGPDIASHKPIIAFEDNAQQHRQDVPDLLS